MKSDVKENIFPSNISSEKAMAELASIIEIYNETADKMQHAHEELQSEVERLRSELNEKNELLERKNRLTALGEMAAGVAHEIRNPLGGIRLYASMLKNDLIGQPDELRLVEKESFKFVVEGNTEGIVIAPLISLCHHLVSPS